MEGLGALRGMIQSWLFTVDELTIIDPTAFAEIQRPKRAIHSSPHDLHLYLISSAIQVVDIVDGEMSLMLRAAERLESPQVTQLQILVDELINSLGCLQQLIDK
ncbi:unnamed protein product [Arabis nemorensis]|uniref:Uncharacterized protein n=1 Tax=Arabis nemorensis TaxID=586526 RepID=A0A565BKU0_9BRAS|nr:unnamed protein product [Arabis nemorensis]